jgi:hypothetical protein
MRDPSLWRGGDTVPSRPGWSHRVRNSRDAWHAVADTSNLVLSVLHLRPTRPDGSFSAGTEGMRFAVLVDGKLLTHVNRPGEASINRDALTVFDDVQKAMAAADGRAREHDIAAMGPVRLLEHPRRRRSCRCCASNCGGVRRGAGVGGRQQCADRQAAARSFGESTRFSPTAGEG